MWTLIATAAFLFFPVFRCQNNYAGNPPWNRNSTWNDGSSARNNWDQTWTREPDRWNNEFTTSAWNNRNNNELFTTPSWNSNSRPPFGIGNGLPDSSDPNAIVYEATYFIVSSRVVRPGQVYRIGATVYYMRNPITLRSSIQRNGVEIAADSKNVKEGVPEVMLMRIPPNSLPGDYRLRVEGLYDGILGGTAFTNETKLVFSQRSMTIFIQTDKPIYKQSEMVRFRAIPITTELKAFDGIVDVFMLDPKGHVMRRWLSRQSNLGTVSLDYQLSDQPVFGNWTIKVIAQGQLETASFLVEEYYQTRFEVNVTMPPFVFITDEYVRGSVMANYTGGAPVFGNLTLKATVRPSDKNSFRYRDFQPVEKYFNFEESFPFWYPRQNYYTWQQIPHLKWFRGVLYFKYPISELLPHLPTLEGMEIQITATVGERYWDEVIEGYSVARFFNSSVKTFFLGGSPQVFKPTMPTTVYVGVSFHDGSPLPAYRLKDGHVDLTCEVTTSSQGRQSVQLEISKLENGIWPIKLDLRSQMGLTNDQRSNDLLKSIDHMRISASFRDLNGERSFAELQLLSHFSPSNHYVKVSTSSEDSKVGQYIMFHVQSNFQMEMFDYVIISKGIILLSAQEKMLSSIHTFAVALSAEMTPSATIVVYHVGKFGDILSDSLTFPVDGMSRNNFTIFINNRKARTGEKVEVAIYGEPGSYVGISGIDRPFYSMQAGNEITYARVLTKMDQYDESNNGSLYHTWLSHQGDPDDIVSFPSSSYGIDANRTFELAGLIVFTDVLVPRRLNVCNYTLGFLECLSGRCYKFDKKCDGFPDCDDGTDEINCPLYNATDLTEFRKSRFNRIQRHYDNVWLWKDVNIGPHGRYIFEAPVPHRPAHWMITAFGVSPTAGFGMLSRPIDYLGALPFFINVEMPSNSRQGEQIGVRVSVFNYMHNDIEAVVLLEGSNDYKFVHVGENGIVVSYAPQTSFGEHQFFVFIKAQDAAIVYLPIVPVRLGDIEVSVRATTLIASDRVTKILHVEADGLPQYRHESVLLDLTNRAYVFQYMHVNVTEDPIIPYDIDRYYIYGSNRATISVVGDVVGPIFPTMPLNATSSLHLPMDGAEQTIFGFASMLYTTMYMRLINQRNRSLEKQSFHHMNIQYQRMISFMNNDGSFSLFRADWNLAPKSVWLTAYAARILQEGSFYEWENYIYIDPDVIAKSMSWLLNYQTEEGSFYDVSWIPDRKANSTVQEYANRNISLTAHCLITLITVKDITGSLGVQIALAQSKAVAYLEKNLRLIDERGDPFERAIVAYALMLSPTTSTELAFNALHKAIRDIGGYVYWGREAVPLPPAKVENQKPYLLPRLPYKYDSINVQTTAYALMVYNARQDYSTKTDGIVKWLNAQRLTDSGWASTQDTAVCMKALIEYTNRNRIKDVSGITVSVEATALQGITKILYINSKNIAQLQKIEIPHAWGTVKVQAKGAGYAILQMSTQFNVDVAKFQTQPPVKAFSLTPVARFHGRNQSHIEYTSCQRWIYTEESPRSGMAVLDVAIPTGYIVQQQKLDAFVRNQNVRNLQRARYTEQKVLFYFEYLDNVDTCVTFTVERWLPVANMSRYLPIRVYDYYAPERFNESIFDALNTYLLTICDVCGSSQCPYCYIYNSASTAYLNKLVFAIVLPLLWHYLYLPRFDA